MYNGSPIIDSFVDIASITLPSSDTDDNLYTPNQYNLLANNTSTTEGYALTTDNNIISIISGCGFSINNLGIYKISFSFCFDYSNTDANPLIIDVMLNGSPLTTTTDIVTTNCILDVNASGTSMSFPGLTNNSIPEYSGESISTCNNGDWGTISSSSSENNQYYDYYINPTILYCSTSYQNNSATASDPPFCFARYCLTTNNEKYVIPNILYFTAIVNITSTENNSNCFYPCICPYNYTIWNSGMYNLPQPYLMVQMISSIPAPA
jgi:hypothetical protein